MCEWGAHFQKLWPYCFLVKIWPTSKTHSSRSCLQHLFCTRHALITQWAFASTVTRLLLSILRDFKPFPATTFCLLIRQREKMKFAAEFLPPMMHRLPIEHWLLSLLRMSRDAHSALISDSNGCRAQNIVSSSLERSCTFKWFIQHVTASLHVCLYITQSYNQNSTKQEAIKCQTTLLYAKIIILAPTILADMYIVINTNQNE